MPNRNYIKGYNFEDYLVNDWRAKGYLSWRMYKSRPFDFWVMGHGESYICEAKNWKRPPTERWFRKEYGWMADWARNAEVTGALGYIKLGRGKNNYIRFEI